MNSIGSGRMTARASAVAASVERRRFVADEPPGGDQPLGQAAGDERVPVVDRRRADLAVQDPVAAVDEPAGVAIGPWIADLSEPADSGRSVSVGDVIHRRWPRGSTDPVHDATIWVRKKIGIAMSWR